MALYHQLPTASCADCMYGDILLVHSFSSSLFAGSRVDRSQSNVPSTYIREFPLLFLIF
jgi:hypothetical protein